MTFITSSAMAGYIPNLTKFKAFCPQPSQACIDLCSAGGIELSVEGMVVVKAPIGSRAFCERYLTKVVDSHRQLFERIPDLPVNVAKRVLRSVAIPRLGYLARTVPPDILHSPANEFRLYGLGLLLQGHRLRFTVHLGVLEARRHGPV